MRADVPIFKVKPISDKISLDLSKCTPQEFEKIFKQHYKMLCLIAFKITTNWQIAEDVVQDFFVKCWQNRHDLGVIENFRAFASISIKNASINLEKKEKTRELHNRIYSIQTNVSSENVGMEEQLKEERLFKLINFINQLPPKRKKIFLLFYFGQLKCADIAKRENISVETVKTQIKLAYHFLRKSVLLIFF